ncbi:hypothetical protein ACRQ5Q_27710 [Bradyrhizobium sp. PMVTL-01]|uniref:hypothetical protein n=1 Tax=Bradyrhizobium sp. PMVTL-01 TaxID=3434999 RepID=UPI003F6FF1BD
MSHLDDLARSDAGDAVAPVTVSEKPERPRASHQDVQRATKFIFVLLVALLLLLYIVLLPADRLLLDPDLYWHIATGRKIWESGSLPQVDEFSHTFRGHPWIARDWLSDLLFFGAYSLSGFRGVAMITGGAVALAYALLFLMLARTMRLTVAIVVATVALLLSVNHLHARPQIFADGLMVVWVAALVRAVDTKTNPSLMLLPVMTLWANVHGSFVAGLALTVALAAEALFESPGSERLLAARRWAVFFVAAVGAACVTPYGARPFLMDFQLIGAHEAKPYINEWRAVSFETAPITLFAVLALLFFALLNGVKIRFCRLTILISITAYMLTAVRFIFLFNLLAPLLLATPLTRQFRFLRLSEQIATRPQFFTTTSHLGRRGLYGAYGIIAIMIVGVGIFGDPVERPRFREISPKGAVDYILEHNLNGNIYNSYNFGGYLIFRGLPTFVDGRNVFDDGFMDENWTIVAARPREFIRYLDKYRVSIGLVAPDSLEAHEFRASSDWIPVYSDDISELFVRGNQLDQRRRD